MPNPSLISPWGDDLINNRYLGGKLGRRPEVDQNPKVFDLKSLLIKHSDIPVPTLGSRRSVSASIGLTVPVSQPSEISSSHSTSHSTKSRDSKPRDRRRKVPVQPQEPSSDGLSPAATAMRSTRSASSSLPNHRHQKEASETPQAGTPSLNIEPPTPISSPLRPPEIQKDSRKRPNFDDVSEGNRRLERSTSADPQSLSIITTGENIKRRRGGSVEPLAKSPLSKTFNFEDSPAPEEKSKSRTRTGKSRGRPAGRTNNKNLTSPLVNSTVNEDTVVAVNGTSISNKGSDEEKDLQGSSEVMTRRASRPIAVPVHLK